MANKKKKYFFSDLQLCRWKLVLQLKMTGSERKNYQKHKKCATNSDLKNHIRDMFPNIKLP